MSLALLFPLNLLPASSLDHCHPPPPQPTLPLSPALLVPINDHLLFPFPYHLAILDQKHQKLPAHARRYTTFSASPSPAPEGHLSPHQGETAPEHHLKYKNTMTTIQRPNSTSLIHLTRTPAQQVQLLPPGAPSTIRASAATLLHPPLHHQEYTNSSQDIKHLPGPHPHPILSPDHSDVILNPPITATAAQIPTIFESHRQIRNYHVLPRLTWVLRRSHLPRSSTHPQHP
jgi:hypothetical protein